MLIRDKNKKIETEIKIFYLWNIITFRHTFINESYDRHLSKNLICKVKLKINVIYIHIRYIFFQINVLLYITFQIMVFILRQNTIKLKHMNQFFVIPCRVDSRVWSPFSFIFLFFFSNFVSSLFALFCVRVLCSRIGFADPVALRQWRLTASHFHHRELL